MGCNGTRKEKNTRKIGNLLNKGEIRTNIEFIEIGNEGGGKGILQEYVI